MNSLPAFHDTSFTDIVGHDGQPWMTSPGLGRAIGYSRAKDLARLYRRHADEFTDSMTAVIRMSQPQFEVVTDDLRGSRRQTGVVTPSEKTSDTRIYSLRGAHLIAMFAKTPRAAEFRRWVLDVLEGLAPPRQQPTDAVAERYRLLGESQQQAVHRAVSLQLRGVRATPPAVSQSRDRVW